MSVIATERGSDMRILEGIEFNARTGSKHMLTQVACAKKAIANLGAEVRMRSKRESHPESAEILV